MPLNKILCHFKPRHRHCFIFQCQVGMTGLDDEASCRWEETVPMAWNVHESPGLEGQMHQVLIYCQFLPIILYYQHCTRNVSTSYESSWSKNSPRATSLRLSIFLVVRLLFFFFLFYHNVTLTAWEHSCLDHRLLTKVLCAPFSCSSHPPQIPRSPAKNNDSAFHRKKYTRGGKLSVCASQTLPDKYDLLTRLYVTVEAESYLQLSFFFLNIFTAIELRYST